MTTKTQVSISIVTFRNRFEQVEAAIKSCLSSEGDVELKVAIIDNSPTDELKRLATIDNRIDYRFLNANVGYGRGHNVGLELYKDWSAYHLVLNPDIVFGKTVIAALVKQMSERTAVGLAMPKILYPDGSLQRGFRLLPSPAVLFARRFGLGRFFAQAEADYEMRSANASAIMNVPFLSGCFMFLRMATAQKVGGFDERYFMYMEDLDLSRRVFSASECLYYPEVAVYHEHQRDSYKSTKLLLIHIRSAIQYFNKWGWIFDRQRAKINQEMKAKYLTS